MTKDKAEGKITIDGLDERGDWIFHVSDNGPSIAQTDYEKIFRLFYTTTAHNEESTGFGLGIVKENIELYDGRIWVESTVGQGSTFVFTLPGRLFDRASNLCLT